MKEQNISFVKERTPSLTRPLHFPSCWKISAKLSLSLDPRLIKSQLMLWPKKLSKVEFMQDKVQNFVIFTESQIYQVMLWTKCFVKSKIYARQSSKFCHYHWIPGNLVLEHIILISFHWNEKNLGNKKFMAHVVLFQIPCFETRNDGLDNIIGALILAGEDVDCSFVDLRLTFFI